jgi:hypothetical protein
MMPNMLKGAGRIAMVLAGSVMLASCGSTSQTPARVASAATTPTATTSTSPATPSSPPGQTYSHTIDVSFKHFTFKLEVDVTLGQAATSTAGQTPPDVAVDMPVSGKAYLRNETPGYKAEQLDIPGLSLWAVYKSGRMGACASSGLQVQAQRPDDFVCAIEVAGLAPTCNGSGDSSVDTIRVDETAVLGVWPGGGPAALPGGPAEFCANTPTVQPGDSLSIGGIDPSNSAFTAELGSKPMFWAVVNDNEPCGEQIVTSEPAGLEACLDRA